MTSSYYRGAQGIILTYDVTRADSFASLDQWLQEMEVYCPGGGREVSEAPSVARAERRTCRASHSPPAHAHTHAPAHGRSRTHVLARPPPHRRHRTRLIFGCRW